MTIGTGTIYTVRFWRYKGGEGFLSAPQEISAGQFFEVSNWADDMVRAMRAVDKDATFNVGEIRMKLHRVVECTSLVDMFADPRPIATETDD